MSVRYAVVLAAVLVAGQAYGHPMGNFSISHFAGISVRADSVELEYLIDMAEIPTFQEMQNGDTHSKAFLAAKAAEFARGLTVAIDGHRTVLRAVSQNVIFPQGAGNLPTMKMGFVYRAVLPESCRTKVCDVSYSDANFPDHTGWKEIVVSTGKGVRRLGAALFKTDRSAHLTDYPTDLVNSPPQDLTATISFSIVTPKVAPPVVIEAPVVVSQAVALQANKQSPPRNAFTELMTRKEITFGFALLAALIAAGLGALHAMEPGHGKTIVAAYLVGSKGTARHALALGLIVTVSHTAGVYLLGAVTLYAQKYIMPDRLYPFLSVLSGILIAGMGIYILLKRLAGDEFSAHVHGAGGHTHGLPRRAPGKKQLLVLGITGGMVPCPAALVVLLSAVALHRVGFGLFLIVAFSVGLAAVLIGMGLTAVYAGRLLAKVPVEGKMVRLWMPAMSAAMITILGVTIAVRGLMTAGILEI